MTAPATPIEALLERLEEMEQRNRRLHPSEQQQTKLDSENVVEAYGRNAAWLGALPDGSRALLMTDRASRATAMISIAGGGATEVLLADRMGRERAALAVLPDGRPSSSSPGKDAQCCATLSASRRAAQQCSISSAETGRQGPR